MIRISLIILNWNGLADLAGCLGSVASQTRAPDEVWVVDNGSADGSVEWIRREYPDVHLIENSENEGFCRGNNQAIAESTGDWVVLLNNDAEIRPDFIAVLSEAAQTVPTCVGMLATRIYMFDRRDVFDSAGLLVYPDGVCRSRGWLEIDQGQYDVSADVIGPNGCAAAYRRSMLDETGCFDESFFAYLEDLDLAMRAQSAGWTCRYVPEAVAYHKKSISSGYHSAFKAHLVERNRIWVALKTFPLRLLILSPAYTLIRYLAQGYAVASGKGISSSFARDYSRWTLLSILMKAYREAAASAGEMMSERRRIRGRRRLDSNGVWRVVRRYRLPLRELALKD